MSKKSTQKPAETKAEKDEAVEGTIETKAQEESEQKPEAPTEQAGDNPANESADPEATKAQESDDEAATTPPTAPAADPAAATETDEAESTPLPASPVATAAPTDLANRLTLAVRGIVATGAPEAVHALHKVELILGDLKNALPAAIAGAGDEPLKADLASLLAVL